MGYRYTGRYIGTCPTCKTVIRVDAEPSRLDDIRFFDCPEGCDSVRCGQVIGYETSKTCDARCRNARRAACECSCGGANHGAGH